MATPILVNPERSFRSAFRAVYGSLPFVAIVYYFLVARLSGNRAIHRQQNRRRIAQIASSWHVLAIFTTFLFDAFVLLYLTFPRRMEHVDAGILYTFGSVISWGLLMFRFSGRQATPWYRLGGFSIMYLLTESCLFAYPHGNVGGSLSTALFVVHAFRLGVVAWLVGITAGSQVIPSRCRNGDEESLPLLRDDDGQNNDCWREGYSTVHGATAPRAESPNRHCAEPEGEPSDVVKFFLPYFWPRHRPFLQLLYIGIGICLLIERALKVFIPLTLGTTVHVLAQSPGNFPWEMILTFIALCCLDSKAGLPAARDYMWLPLDKYALSRVSTAAFGKVMDLSRDFHDSKDPNSVWDSINRGLFIRYAFRAALFQLIPTIADSVLAVIVLFAMFGGYMGLIILMAEVWTIWIIKWITPKLHSRAWQMKYGMDEEQAIFNESASNWLTASSFNRVDQAKTRFGAAVTNRTESSLKFFQLFQLESVSQSFIWSLGFMGACLLAAYQVVFEKKPFVCFVILVAYWVQLSGPLQALTSDAESFAYRVMGATELALLLKRRPTVHNQDGAKSLLARRGILEFQNVNFAANDGTQSLSNVSFNTGSGRKVAIVGDQGGGKSTVFNLALRLHDPGRGIITIDSHDIRNVTLESLHASIGIVPRDVAVFSGTIMENIRYANPLLTEEQVYQACEYVGLHDRFLSLPDAYATHVGHEGLKLTRGDRQLVAIARVMVKDPKIILVDEATDVMDINTEALIQTSLMRLCAGRTTISIAYADTGMYSLLLGLVTNIYRRRISTTVNADEVLILDNGELVGQGSHNLLFATNDYYRHLLRYLLSTTADLRAYTAHASEGNRVQKDISAVGESQVSAEIHSTVPDDEGAQAPQTDDHVAIGASDGSTESSAPATFSETLLLSKGKNLKNIPSDNAHKGSSRNITRMCAWKPDAPEFVPASQRSVPMGSQAVAGQKAIYNQQREVSNRSECHGNQKENVSELSNASIENEGVLRGSVYGQNKPARVAQTSHDLSETNESRQFGAVLEPTTNGEVLMSPKKPRKKKGLKKKHILRRHLTKSEPAGVGLTPFD